MLSHLIIRSATFIWKWFPACLFVARYWIRAIHSWHLTRSKHKGGKKKELWIMSWANFFSKTNEMSIHVIQHHEHKKSTRKYSSSPHLTLTHASFRRCYFRNYLPLSTIGMALSTTWYHIGPESACPVVPLIKSLLHGLRLQQKKGVIYVWKNSGLVDEWPNERARGETW